MGINNLLFCLTLAVTFNDIFMINMHQDIYQRWSEIYYESDLSSDDVGAFTDNCLMCICHVEGCQSQIGKCRMDMGSLSCGPFQIKEPYWEDCGKPGSSWKGCTTQMECSKTCVRNYMRRYGKYCTGGREPTCKDYAMIHNGGPKGCQKHLIGYWNKVKACCVRRGGCD